MAEFLLTVSDTSTADSLSLAGTAATGYQVLMHAFGSLPGGWNLPVYDMDSAGRGRQGETIHLTLPLHILSATSVNDVFRQVHNVFWKLEEARRSTGPYALGTRVTLWIRMGGATDYTLYDVQGGTFQPLHPLNLADYNLQGPTIHAVGMFSATCLPYGRGGVLTDVASGTMTNGALASVQYRHNVPGDCRALTQYKLTDVSTGGKVIQRVRLWTRSLRPLLATDFAPIIDTVALSPGASQADATAVGGSYNRITGSAAWQNIGSATGGTGTAQSGLMHVWGRVRDSSVVLAGPTNATATPSGAGGNLPEGTYYAYLTTKDGSNNESVPIALPSAVVPYMTTAFFDGAESNDTSLWDGYNISPAAGGVNAKGAINPDTNAAYTASGLPSTYGFRADAANGGGITLRKLVPGITTISALRCRMRINTNSGGVGNIIPITTDSSGNVTAGSTLGLYTVSGGWGCGFSAVNAASSFILPEGDWIRFEAYLSFAGGTTTWTIYVNDVQVKTGSVTLIQQTYMAIGALAGSSGALQVDFDDVQIHTAHIGANTGSIVYTWTAGTGGNGYFLYPQRNSGTFRQISIATMATATYTLTSATTGTIGTNPPTTAPAIAPGQYRLQYGISGANLVTQQQPTSAALSNALWEDLLIATIPWPPQGYQEGGAALAPYLAVQGKSGGTNTPTLDVDCVWLEPADEPDNAVECSYPGATLGTKAIWQIDSRYDGLVSCTLYDASNPTSVIGQATTTGRLMLGPGDNIVVAQVAVGDGSGHPTSDTNNAQYTLQAARLTPRYVWLQGQQPALLTVSGNEITDVLRWRDVSGDGIAYPDRTMGIWDATTNLALQGNNLNTTWTKTNCTVVEGNAVDVYGNLTGNTVTTTNTNASLSQTIAVTANTQYTFSWWAKRGTQTDVKYSIQDVTHSAAIVAATTYYASINSSTWTQMSATFTTPAGCTSVAIRPIDNSGQTGTVLLWRVQLEAKPVAFPYDSTTTGSATRAAARAQFPVSVTDAAGNVRTVLSAAQGWVALRLRLGGAAGGLGDYSGLFSWGSGTDWIISYFGPQGTLRAYIDVSHGATNPSTSQASALGTNGAGTYHTVVVSWTASTLGVSVDGAAFTTTPNTAAPAPSPTLADIGWCNSLAGITLHADSSYVWVLAGTGTLTSTDAATLHANGNTKPARSLLPVAAAISLSWICDTDQVNEQ